MDKRTQLLRVVLTALAVGLVGFFAFWVILMPFFSGHVILPQALNLGLIKIQFYGMIIAVAVFSGYGLVLRRKEQHGIASDDGEILFFITIIWGFLGARVYHILSELGYYLDYPMQTFAVWNGGLSIYGAALGGIIGLLIYTRITKKYSMFQLLDWMVPAVVLGQIIGRFGNFMNYEIYGYPTELPWKMYVPAQFRIPPFEINQFFHPLFLYEAAGSAMIFVLLLSLKLRRGALFLLWLFLYNVMRFFLEFLRVGSVTYGTVRINAIVSLILALAAIFIWYRIKPDTNNAL